ncbi:MAG: dUTP diphosphatase [Nanoarchaeota archaeon]|nr:dUTP diphosphatase [Nanoarchaeota archaeon]
MLNPLKIKIKKIGPDAVVPSQGSFHAAGFDIYSNENIIIFPEETKLVPTGLAFEIPEGKVLFIWDRSGMGAKGIHRFSGVIDSDYRGEVKIALFNSTKEPYEIKKGDRICQGIVQDYYKPEFMLVEELSETKRGDGSFGSTGR